MIRWLINPTPGNNLGPGQSTNAHPRASPRHYRLASGMDRPSLYGVKQRH